jgi:type 1 glutamine amidotransferase
VTGGRSPPRPAGDPARTRKRPALAGRLGQHDRAVPDDRADHRAAALAQFVEEPGQRLGIERNGLLGHRASSVPRLAAGAELDRREVGGSPLIVIAGNAGGRSGPCLGGSGRIGSMRALLVRGGWDGHEPVACTELFRDFLEGNGFRVRTADSLAVYADRDLLGRTDLIVQCWTGGRLTPEQENGLVERVHAGAGFAGWHGGVLAVGYEASRYQYMVGGRFLFHPGGFVDYTVDITGDHPIVEGIAGFAVHTEQYYCHVDPRLEVLATTTFAGAGEAPETAGVVMPVVWVRRFGAGRVFVCTLGHGPADLRVAPTRLLTERGLRWAGGISPGADNTR